MNFLNYLYAEISQAGWPELILVMAALVPGVVGGVVAKNKGRGFLFWGLICFVLPPLLILIFWLHPAGQVEGRIRKCPRCRGYLAWSATQCWHCGHYLFDTETSGPGG